MFVATNFRHHSNNINLNDFYTLFYNTRVCSVKTFRPTILNSYENAYNQWIFPQLKFLLLFLWIHSIELYAQYFFLNFIPWWFLVLSTNNFTYERKLWIQILNNVSINLALFRYSLQIYLQTKNTFS